MTLSKENISDLERIHGIDAGEELARIFREEIDKEIIDSLRRLHLIQTTDKMTSDERIQQMKEYLGLTDDKDNS